MGNFQEHLMSHRKYRTVDVLKVGVEQSCHCMRFLVTRAVCRANGPQTPNGDTVKGRAQSASASVSVMCFLRGVVYANGPHTPNGDTVKGRAHSASASVSVMCFLRGVVWFPQ